MKKKETLDTKVECMSIETTQKPFYMSKTLWFGVLKIILGIALAICDHVLAGDVLTALGVITIALRFMTTQAITLNYK